MDPITPAEVSQNSPQNPVVTSPDLDAELDAALSKSFPNNSPAPENEPDPKETKKDPEVKAEAEPKAKVDAKKQDKPAEAEKPLLTPDEIDKIEPKKQDAWTALKNNNKRSHSIIKEKEEEISRLKAVVAEKGALSQKEVEALKAENGELAKYRAMIDIQADPEFLSKYDQPIEKTVSSIKAMLIDMNVSDEIIKQVDFTNTKLMDEIISHVGEHRDKFVARKLERKVEELVSLTDQRNETLAEQKEKYKETLEARKKQAFEKDTESEGRALKHLETVAAAKDKTGNSMFPFLNKQEAKDGSTQPEIDQVNAHNKMVELMQQKVQQAFKMNEPEERMEVAVAAATAHYYAAQLKAANAKLKSLQEEIQKISAVSTESDKSKTPAPRNRNNGHIMDTDEALAAHFGR